MHSNNQITNTSKMDTTNTPQGTETAREKTAATDAGRYPLIKSPLYRRCLEGVLYQITSWLRSKGGADKLKSHPIKQLALAGNLNADFMLRHFAGIFDGNSPLSSGQRNTVRAILTDAAQKMSEMQSAVMAKAGAEKEAAAQ